MNNGEYWSNRMELLNENLLNKAEDYEQHFIISYQNAINEIQKEINNFYSRFAKDNKISYLEAKKRLSLKERSQFRMDIDEYIKKAQQHGLSNEWIKTLNNAATTSQIDRLESLQIQMRQQIELLEKDKVDTLKTIASEIYEEGYYRAIYELQKGMGIGQAFSILDTKAIEKVLSKPWTIDGKTFSDRIWEDKHALLNSLQTTFTQGIISGTSPEKIVNSIVKKMGSNRSATWRLVLTESAAFASSAQYDSYKELDVEFFDVLVTLDEKTCETCSGHERAGPLPISEYSVGVTAPPFHPWCRCTTIPHFNDEFTADEQRAARGADGKTYYVPGNMTYDEWRSKYVDGNINNASFIHVNNASVISKDIIEKLNQELMLMPENHKNIIKSTVREIELITSGNSRFNRKTGVLYLDKDFIEGELIHEFGHAIETRLDLYHNEEFLKVLNNGLEDITPFDIIDDEDSFIIPVQRLESDKFISEYQGFLYETDIDGNERINDFSLNTKCLGEYFSEGYRVYLTNPELLKSKDIDLYNFINKKLVNK